MEWREANGTRWLEARLAGATAAFSTRLGGISEAPFDSLNLGVLTEDEGGAVVENRRRLAAALGFPAARIAIGRQVHGAELASHAGPQSPSPFAEPGNPIREVDGHTTSEANLPLLVFVADCVPVALAGRGGVAMLHCGWRGLASSPHTSRRIGEETATPGLVERAVEAIGATEAAIGPAVGPCCYEVGPEVRGQFAGLGAGVASGRALDLPEVAERLLRAAGVTRVERSDLCTGCHPELFFSHRRNAGRSGRQAGLVWRTAEAS